MLDRITTAAPTDFDAVWQLFADVCSAQASDAYGADWELGVYPARTDIEGHLSAGDLYVGLKDGRIVAAMVVTPHEDPEYADIPWTHPCEPNEVAVIHLLAVHPNMRGQHAGAELVQEAIRLAGIMNKSAIHLDVVPGNLAASRIYRQAGFSFVGTYQIFYEDTGLADFDMYEYVV